MLDFDPIEKMTKDLRNSSGTLGANEARFLVSAYYMIQEDRKRNSNQERALIEAKEPHEVISWFKNQTTKLEGYIKQALDVYGDNDPLGRWAKGIIGIGPVLSAGLLAHIDMRKAKTAGAIWSYAGLNSRVAWMNSHEGSNLVLALVDNKKQITTDELLAIAARLDCCPKWLSRRVRRVITEADIPVWGWETQPDKDYVEMMLDGLQVNIRHVVESISKRPWNADLKVLAWKIGQSFVYCSAKPESTYGQIYRQRKELETLKNEKLEFSDQAASILRKKRIGKGTEAYKAYSKGMLPKAHINMRAQRYATKLFLSHYFEMGCKLHLGKEPPTPWIIEHGGHEHWLKAEDAR